MSRTFLPKQPINCPHTNPTVHSAQALNLGALFKLQQRAFVMYSDTHGASWKRGGFLPLVASETALAELSDGSILASSRMAEMGWQNVPSKRLFSSPSPLKIHR